MSPHGEDVLIYEGLSDLRDAISSSHFQQIWHNMLSQGFLMSFNPWMFTHYVIGIIIQKQFQRCLVSVFSHRKAISGLYMISAHILEGQIP